jgi:glutamate-5-semialdehyde dehydrogenase
MSVAQELSDIRKASKSLVRASEEQINAFLTDLSVRIFEQKAAIQLENRKDLALMDPIDAKYDRLMLTEERINALVLSLKTVASLTSNRNKIIEEKTLTNGIVLEKWAVPMGVIGVIYESRPNVTIDVASLCIKSGNAAVLKGGKEAYFSNRYLVDLIQASLINVGLPKNLVYLFPTDRKYLTELLEADKYVDLIIPRGSQSLIDFVRQHSKIPTIETGAGVCHTYVDQTADTVMAAEIIINARASRPSVCNSLDTAIVHKDKLREVLTHMLDGLKKYDIGVYADSNSRAILENLSYHKVYDASPDTYAKEWLSQNINIKTVSDIREALEHLELYSSRHSEAIITEDLKNAELFLSSVDSAAVYHNASTRFTDGEEFGLGAEIGISTQKLHARGPFALDKLSTEKWVGKGSGQVRW